MSSESCHTIHVNSFISGAVAFGTSIASYKSSKMGVAKWVPPPPPQPKILYMKPCLRAVAIASP